MNNIINMLDATNRIISHTTNHTERERLKTLRTRINVVTSVSNIREADRMVGIVAEEEQPDVAMDKFVSEILDLL